MKGFENKYFIFFTSIFILSFSSASCRDLITKSVQFMEVGELCDLRSYVSKFKQMSQEELLVEKNTLDANENLESFVSEEIHLVKRWLVEIGLQTNQAEATKDALVDYYFERFHKLSDPMKFHVDHPLVVQSRLVKSYRDL